MKLNRLIPFCIGVFFSLWCMEAQNKSAVVSSANESGTSAKIIVAYVVSWSNVLPDPYTMTHINYAFGHVTDSFNGIRIDKEERLRQIIALKKENPDLQILLSVGGWGSGGFSEMAMDSVYRTSFATDCRRVIDEFGLDGIDMDWEYPTSSAANITSSSQDADNFILLMQAIREAIGPDKLLTMASVATANFLDFPAILPYMDFINIMAYDMSVPPYHHAPLYRSELAGRTTSEEAVNAHLEAGVPINKLVLGMPFYGRGDGTKIPAFVDYKNLSTLSEYKEVWDETAQVPYLTNEEGTLVFTYENPRSLEQKCNYIKEKGLLGGMYWEYTTDTPEGELRKVVYQSLLEKQ